MADLNDSHILFNYEWHIKSEQEQVPLIIQEMLQAMDERLTVYPDERDDIKLILNELMFNAVIHGNHSDKAKQIHVLMHIGNRFVCISIRDEGAGFDDADYIQSSKYEDALEKETGRGMKLVRAMADEVTYSAKGRQVTFIKRMRFHG